MQDELDQALAASMSASLAALATMRTGELLRCIAVNSQNALSSTRQPSPVAVFLCTAGY
jgi:hypothetical protein